ncbi:CgeB family protein [Roseivivax isoporae]|uniref:Glycosyltransferase n=1 Tax=Roseivivax isoporae LMG 25204 TaxID=1449351 RepID=X7F803_9RHOB|nr:glycosyltransferase [Roseivivax isoporae]ETX29007.1 glycosyltransferase [Roseivivax isoporae LMG 25204]
MRDGLNIVVFGLSLSSSWGNGHATTFRALLRGFAAEGHSATFLERDVPWYRPHRDMTDPEFCRLAFYDDIDAVLAEHGAEIDAADAVIVGSYVPEGARLIDALGARGVRRLCFYDIDTPVTMAALEKGGDAHLERRQVPRLDTYFSFSGGRVLDTLRRRHGARNPVALHCAVDPDLYHPVDVPRRWDLGYLGTYSPDRQPTLERLLLEPARQRPELSFVVAGPLYPEDMRWPPNVTRIEHLPPDAHVAFYAAQRFTLNVTRAAMRAQGWSPSVRLFEAAACGVPVVSDTWPGLGELLPEGQAILTAAETADMLRILDDTDDTRRDRIARAARARVLEAHTGRARARELARALLEGAVASRGGDAREAATS